MTRYALRLTLLVVAVLGAGEAVRVVRVSDGDTFHCSDGQVVRMLGIDAAESYQAGGDVATEMLEKYILGRTVRLEPDVTDKDHFGRLLRFVWVGDTCVNMVMVEHGYAPVILYQEGLKYEDTLELLEEQAAAAGRGLWAFNVYTPPTMELIRKRLAELYPGDSGVISWQDAGEHVGELAIVEGTIVRTYQSDQVLFMNFAADWRNTFTVAIFVTDLHRFPENARDYYQGKKVRVSSIVKEYRGAPEMVVKNPEQIEVLEQEP